MDIYNFSVRTIQGEEKRMEDYRGKVLLIVNTATQCGFAPQLRELQQLHDRYSERGLAVLGFPCNQFRHQEPGSNQDVEQACTLNFGVSFPLFAKIDVNGPAADPLFTYLKRETTGLFGSTIKWNFTKFLIDRNGRPVKRYSPTTRPVKFESAIKKLLEQR
ncbi:glutathione peroxidase [Paenibacillus sp. GCM10027626]|uniref:glutathione peroxidase n=1 Tax=Paenibacillus sp. GCM10027626 TaxID=3273411 RepID=UPI0036403908